MHILPLGTCIYSSDWRKSGCI